MQKESFKEVSPVKIDVEKVFVINEGLSWFDDRNIHLIFVFSDNSVHETHLRPDHPTLEVNQELFKSNEFRGKC